MASLLTDMRYCFVAVNTMRAFFYNTVVIHRSVQLKISLTLTHHVWGDRALNQNRSGHLCLYFVMSEYSSKFSRRRIQFDVVDDLKLIEQFKYFLEIMKRTLQNALFELDPLTSCL